MLALVRVKAQEQSAVFRVGNIARKRPAAARQIAVGRLDLDYLGAEVGEQARGKGCRNSLTAFDYDATGQRSSALRVVGQSRTFESCLPSVLLDAQMSVLTHVVQVAVHPRRL